MNPYYSHAWEQRWPIVGAPLGYAPFVPAQAARNAFAMSSGTTVAPEENKTSSFRSAVKAVTPTLFVVSFVSGIAFGLAGGLVSRYVFGRT